MAGNMTKAASGLSTRMLAAMAAVVVVAAAVAAGAGGVAVADDERDLYDVRVFTPIGSPGMPEGIAVDHDGTVYVSTHNHNAGDAEEPSRVFAFASDGTLVREYVVEGQPDGGDGGLLGMAFDADGLLYVIDRAPPRVLVLDPATGEQWDHASFRRVPPCWQVDEGEECSDTTTDLDVFPDDLVFAPDGTMYVTDLEQALIWRVPPGGGEAEVWFTDRRLESVFGPNGIRLLPDGRTLIFNQTTSAPPGTADPATARIYLLPIGDDGSAGELELFWEGQPADGADNLALGASGNVYVALAGANQLLVLSPEGEEIARVPETPVENQMQEIPFDMPAGIAFLEQRVLLTNQSFFTQNPDTWAVLDVHVGEEKMPLFRPSVMHAAADEEDAAASTDDAAEPTPATGGGLGPVALLVLAGLLLGLRRRPAHHRPTVSRTRFRWLRGGPRRAPR